MNFTFYFLKEGTRLYEKTELITYLVSNQYITPPSEDSTSLSKVYTYYNPILKFKAEFVMADKNIIPHLEKISPKYFDVNFCVRFNILLSNFAVEMLLDIIEDIVKKFKFFLYNQAFPDVVPYRRDLAIKTFDSWKKAYATQNPELVAKYNYLDTLSYSQVCNYLIKKRRLELTIANKNIKVSDYIFLTTEKSRTTYIAVEWDGESQIVLPPAVDILYLNDGKTSKYIAMNEIFAKTEKLFIPIDGYGNIMLLEEKAIKKLHKLLLKERFAPLHEEIIPFGMEKILDV